MTFWPEKLPRWPVGARKTNLSFFVGVVFFEKWPTLAQKKDKHRPYLWDCYPSWCHKDPQARDALPEPRDVTFQNQKRHEHHERLTPCWHHVGILKIETQPPNLCISKNVGQKFSSTSTSDSPPILGTPKNLGGTWRGLGPRPSPWETLWNVCWEGVVPLMRRRKLTGVKSIQVRKWPVDPGYYVIYIYLYKGWKIHPKSN